MKYRLTSFLLFGLMLVAAPVFAQGIVHDEAGMGDLSDTGPAPTPLGVFGLGVSTIQGTLGPSAGGSGASNGSSDADIFTFNIAPGQFVTSVTTTRTGPGSVSFVGQSSSSSIAAFSSNATLGAALNTGSTFSNGTPTVASLGGGLATTFGAGPQTFILQETGAGPVDYSISFTVAEAIPEPSSAALLGGLAMVGFIRRRRR